MYVSVYLYLQSIYDTGFAQFQWFTQMPFVLRPFYKNSRRMASTEVEQTFWLHVWGKRCEPSRAGHKDLKLRYLWRTSFWDSADKWGWKERLAACRRICFSLLIWTSILMGHLTLIRKLDLEIRRVPQSTVTLLPEQGNGKPLWASKMHYLCFSVCSAFSPVAQLIVSIVPYWQQSSL